MCTPLWRWVAAAATSRDTSSARTVHPPAELVVAPARDVAADERPAGGVAGGGGGGGGGLLGAAQRDGAGVQVSHRNTGHLVTRQGRESLVAARPAVVTVAVASVRLGWVRLQRTVHEGGSCGALDTMPLESSPKQRTRHGSACQRRHAHNGKAVQFLGETVVVAHVVFQPAPTRVITTGLRLRIRGQRTCADRAPHSVRHVRRHTALLLLVAAKAEKPASVILAVGEAGARLDAARVAPACAHLRARRLLPVKRG